MDPVVSALIQHYGMTPDLAQRVAQNLQQPGAATGAYPAVAHLIGPQAPVAQPPVPSVIRRSDRNAGAHPSQSAPQPMVPSAARRSDRNRGAQPGNLDWKDNLQAYEGTLAKGRQIANDSRDNELAVAQAEQDRLDQELKQKRVQHYEALVDKTKRGEDIGEDNREWLKKVHSASSIMGPRGRETGVVRPLVVPTPKPQLTANDLRGQLTNQVLDNRVPGGLAFSQGMSDAINGPPKYAPQPVDLQQLQGLGLSLEDATNYLISIRGY